MKKVYAAFLLVISMILSSCGIQKSAKSFEATVIETGKDYIIVEPAEGEDELKSADQIMVSKKVSSKEGVPDIEEGDRVEIAYDGAIAESYPAKLGDVYSIRLADETD